MSELLQAALAYAKIGWHIFPCKPGLKVPATRHGVKDATTDLNQIQNWWRQTPDANIGLACGSESGVYAVDVDVKSNENGWNSLDELAAGGHSLPDTIKQDTPRGGAHFLYKAKEAPGNKNGFKPGIDIRSDGFYIVLTPSIHPNGGKYAWGEDRAPWEIGLAEFPDFMRPIVAKPKVYKRSSIPVIRNIATDPHTVERAKAYLATCDPAIQGEQGHNKLLWAAFCMVQGFLLTETQAMSLLMNEYNPKCDPPWDFSIQSERKDFERKIVESGKLSSSFPRGWLLADDTYQDMAIEDALARIDLGKILENKKPNVQVENTKKVNPIADNEYSFLTQPTGMLGEMCSWMNSTAMMRQPLLSVGASLTFCGALFGRKVRDESGLRTNIYCMGLADSSFGKQHPLDKITSLIEHACVDHLYGGNGFASDTGIEESLEENQSLIFLLDEVGHFLKGTKDKSKSHLIGIVPTLMRLYSSAKSIWKGKAYANRESQRVIVQPCLCIWGASDESRFREGCTPSEIKDGWLSRCMVFQAIDRPSKQRNIFYGNPPANLVNQIVAWADRAIQPPKGIGDTVRDVRHTKAGAGSASPHQIVVHTTQEASKLFYEFDNEANERGKENSDFDCLWRKVEENARKIALIVAASESYDNPVVTAAVADYAVRLVRYLLLNFIIIAGDITENIHEESKLRIRRIIGNYGINGCSQGELTRKTQWIKSKHERNAYIEDLKEACLVIEQAQDRKKVLWTIGNYSKHLKTYGQTIG